MITLATLHQATAQEVFDQVATHLMSQGEKSERDSALGCAYREGNLKCAAGCLISDAEYQPGFEGKDWGYLVESGCVPAIYKDLISDLQTCHDDDDEDGWLKELIRIAKLRDLNTTALEPWITGS